jgi:hypothetical protein
MADTETSSGSTAPIKVSILEVGVMSRVTAARIGNPIDLVFQDPNSLQKKMELTLRVEDKEQTKD